MRFGGPVEWVWLASAGLASGCIERGEVLGPPLQTDGDDTGSVGSDAGSSDDVPVMPTVGAAFSVSAGDRHACAVLDGQAYCWGDNASGQLGTGTTSSSGAPLPVAAPEATNDAPVWVQIAAAASHTCALDDLGQVYCWGENDAGQLGVGDRETRLFPTLVELSERATRLDADFDHGCALLNTGLAECWGNNFEGSLGLGDDFPGDATPRAADALTPVVAGAGETYRSIETGQGHSCGIRLDGSLWCWGRNSASELGASDQIQIRTPIQVGADSDWLEVDAGQSHTCALREDRSLWCWGRSYAPGASEDSAPLGIEQSGVVESPTRVGSQSDWFVLTTNTFHTCARNRTSALWCWGRNIEGQLGLGDSESRLVPSRVPGEYGAVSAGRFATCALSSMGEVLCSGENGDGQLGRGDSDRSSQFVAIQF